MKELVCQHRELEVNDQTSYFALVTEEWSGQVLKNGNSEPRRYEITNTEILPSHAYFIMPNCIYTCFSDIQLKVRNLSGF